MPKTTPPSATEPATQTISLKMARATPEDENTVNIIHGMLDDVFGGSQFAPAGFPRGTDGEFDENDPQFFDCDNKEHLNILFNRLQAVIEPNPGAMLRVAFGYNTLAHPENALIDPDADTLQWHPRFHRQDVELEHLRVLNAALLAENKSMGETLGISQPPPEPTTPA